MRDGENVGGFPGRIQKYPQKPRHMLPRYNRVGVRVAEKLLKINHLVVHIDDPRRIVNEKDEAVQA